MRLKYFKPSPPFQDWLTAHAIVDSVPTPMFERFPAMLPNLHIRLGGSTTYFFEDGAVVEAPQVALLGPTLSSYRVLLGPGLHLVATGFLPDGCTRLIGVPARELTDRIVDATAIWGQRAIDRLLDQLIGQHDETAIGAIVERFLVQQAREPASSSSTADAVDYWLEHSPSLDLAELQALLGVGDRHMRRLVMESHGAAPKALAMKYRALRAAASIAFHGTPALSRAMAPYADQAHFIRDFRRFTGWAPGAFVAQNRNAAASTLAGRRQAGIVRPLSLWS